MASLTSGFVLLRDCNHECDYGIDRDIAEYIHYLK